MLPLSDKSSQGPRPRAAPTEYALEIAIYFIRKGIKHIVNSPRKLLLGKVGNKWASGHSYPDKYNTLTRPNKHHNHNAEHQ